MPQLERAGSVTIRVPDARPDEAAEILQYLEQEMIAGEIPRDTIGVERKSGEQMFIAEALTIIGWGMKAIDWGSKIATLIRAINWASERWGRSISLTNADGKEVRIGNGAGNVSSQEAARQMGLDFGAQSAPVLSKPATLGVVLLGASEFPYWKNQDNPSFKRSAELFRSLLQPDNLTFKNIVILDLFDRELLPHELTKSIMDFIDKHQLEMRDIIFYYCGHGGFLPGQTFYLLIKASREAQKATTVLRTYDLRQDLDKWLIDKRVYLIFDCCYSSAAGGDFGTMQAADEAFGLRVTEGFPAYGTALLSAASSDIAALAPKNEDFTMFTGALADVIRNGAPGQDERLSLQSLRDAVRHRIARRYDVSAVYPELHLPRQKAGDISTLPLFLNKAPKDEQRRGRRSADPVDPPDIEAQTAIAGQNLKSGSVPFKKTAVAELARLYSITSNEGLRKHIRGLLEEAQDDDSRSVQEEVRKYLPQISALEKPAQNRIPSSGKTGAYSEGKKPPRLFTRLQAIPEP
ncbi:MAG: caspase family protein [Rhodomicrobium sp.]